MSLFKAWAGAVKLKFRYFYKGAVTLTTAFRVTFYVTHPLHPPSLPQSHYFAMFHESLLSAPASGKEIDQSSALADSVIGRYALTKKKL